MKFLDMFCSTHWPLRKLVDVCFINPRPDVDKAERSLTVSFVPMADLPENQMWFEPAQTKSLIESASSYTFFREGDVLLAKVTPCFENGKAGIPRSLLNGMGLGTSELHVLRGREDVLPEWIYFAVRHPSFRNHAISNMTGSGGLRRVPRECVESFEIPVPPVEEQRRVIANLRDQLTRVNQAHRALSDQLAALDRYPAALLREAFAGRL